jgi:hypothetical protein
MKNLKIFGWIVLAAMIGVTTWASLEKGVGWGFQWLFSERWGIATLFDAYFGFLFFFLWVLFKEARPLHRFAWFIFIILFGNIAMAIFFLRQVYGMKKEARVSDLFLSR